MRLLFPVIGLLALLAACESAEVAPKPAPTVTPPPKTAPPPPVQQKPAELGPLSEAESDIARTFDRAFVVMPAPKGARRW
ncbi:MAG: hypothetical protein QF893_24920 [Alphaproteobacteria bacterium]|jgi:hypothetical protein|nr:hypothetical protein [Alphaproteobacteria bacterium]